MADVFEQVSWPERVVRVQPDKRRYFQDLVLDVQLHNVA